jgi:hypothetical protein
VDLRREATALKEVVADVRLLKKDELGWDEEASDNRYFWVGVAGIVYRVGGPGGDAGQPASRDIDIPEEQSFP